MAGFAGPRGIWPVLVALVLATVALAVLSIQAVRRESAARRNLLVDTHRGVADLLSARLSAAVSEDERAIAAAVNGGRGADALVDALVDIEARRPWLHPLVVAIGKVDTSSPEESTTGSFTALFDAAEQEEVRLKNYDAAVEQYSRAAAEAPTAADKLQALNGLARTEVRASRPDRAAKASHQLLEAADYFDPEQAKWALYAHDRLLDCDAALADRDRLREHALAFYGFLVRYRFVLDRETIAIYTQRVRDTLADVQLTPAEQKTWQRLRDREASLVPHDDAIRSRVAPGAPARAGVAYPLATHFTQGLKQILGAPGPWSELGIAVVDSADRQIFASVEPVPSDATAATESSSTKYWRVLAFPRSGSLDDLAARDVNRYALWLVLVFGTVVVALILAARSVSRELMLARLRAEFVAGVSHELKTPLSLIRMFGESLREGWVAEPKKQDYYEVITRESERLTGLINNVLDFSRLESGTRRYAFDTIDLRPLLDDILNRYEFHLRAANIDLVCNLGDTPFRARVDRDAIEQVIVNLLSNAVKYMGDAEKPLRRIHVSLSREGQAVVLRVGDTGIGISDAHQPYIFDRFYRSDDERVRAITGSGLGLTLVKAHIDAHAGTIVVDSTPNRGSTFSVFLPLATEALPS